MLKQTWALVLMFSAGGNTALWHQGGLAQGTGYSAIVVSLGLVALSVYFARESHN